MSRMNRRQNMFSVLIALAMVFLVESAMAAPLKLYVSPDCDDNADGRSEKVTADHGPFLTIQQARDEIRRLKKSHRLPDEGAIITLADGVYHLASPLELNEWDSGTSKGEIVYRAANRSGAILTGSLHGLKTQPVSDQQVLKRLSSQAREHVLEIDLRDLYKGGLPGFASGGAGFFGTREFSVQLYQAQKRLDTARWPNEGFTQGGECFGEFKMDRHVRAYLDGIFRFDNERLQRWALEPELWLHGRWYQHWADQKMKVKAIDLNEKTISLADPRTHHYGFREGMDFYAFNALCEIDQPGEWMLDRPGRKVYVWPVDDPQKAPMQLAVTQNLLVAYNLEHVTFDGIVFEGTTGDAAKFVKAQHVTVQSCTIERTGGWGIHFAGGSNCAVMACDMSDLGEGGAWISGGDLATLTHANHLVENCHIHNIGNVVETYRPGVRADGVGNKVRHNLIYDSPHNGLGFDGAEHLFEYNVIHDVCIHTSDAGAIYACTRDWSKRGTIIRYNIIHSLGKALDNAGCHGIYLDDSTSGTIVHGNIVTMCTTGISYGGGRDGVVSNNLVLDCDVSIDMASRSTDSFAAFKANKGNESEMFKALYKAHYIKSDLWRKRYPQVIAILENNEDPVRAHDALGNTIVNNIMVSGKLHIANMDNIKSTLTLKDNIVTDGDPGLMDTRNLDFRFKPDAEILKQVPEFEQLPVEKMGLYDSPERPTPARRFGPDVKPLPEILTIEQLREKLPKYKAQWLQRKKIVIDGHINHDEWNLSSADALSCDVNIGGTSTKYPAKAYIAGDEWLMNIAVQIKVDPDKPLVTDGKWGARDGFEMAFRDPTQRTTGTYLIRCYPDGSFESVPGHKVTEAQAQMMSKYIKCAATVQKDQWTCELSLFFKTASIDPKLVRQLLFNLNIRRMCDSSWTAWTPMSGAFRDIDKAGMVIFPEH